MSRTTHGGPKLPSALLNTIDTRNKNGSVRPRNFSMSKPIGRKQQRKALRARKRQSQRQTHSFPAQALQQIDKNNVESGTKQRCDVVEEARLSSRASWLAKVEEHSSATTKSAKVKSSPPLISQSPRISRAVRAKLDEDNAEIAALEKRLGIKNTKSNSTAASHDSLDALLRRLDPEETRSGAKRKRSDYEDYLSSKRTQIDASVLLSNDEELRSDESNTSSASYESGSDDYDAQDSHRKQIGEFDAKNDSVDFYAMESDDSHASELVSDIESNKIASSKASESRVDSGQRSIRRENPYVAPILWTSATSDKVIPPTMRVEATDNTEDLRALRRKLKGLLNRLSEPNLLSILRDLERIYASNARQHVTAIIVDLLMDLLCDRSGLIDTFVILHAGFAAALYKVIGAHFGAELLERVVTEFERHYKAAKIEASSSKETTNLIGLLAELYTFQLVGCNVIFDYIRIFLGNLSELNTELLLKIIKNCGPQLRHDDPASLKDIVILLQKSVADVGETNLPVRTKFMIETINDLKNNRLKAGASASIVAADHTSRMKKLLGGLNPQAKTTEPLGVRLVDIKSSDKDGKWWLVGSSWKNTVQKVDPDCGAAVNDNASDEDEALQGGVRGQDGGDLLALAKQQRMNTDIRTAIFMNIMSAEDFKDAYARLTRLKLKKAQELEIPRVLIHCASAEQSYNPYYTLIAKQLCTEHRYKWAMQYSLWNLFKRMGEKSSLDEESDDEMNIDGDDSMDLKTIVNLGRMYGCLIADDVLFLSSLKVLNFAYLQAKTKSFLEVLMCTVFKQLSKGAKQMSGEHDKLETGITAVLMRAKENTQVISGLQYFLSKEADLEQIASSNAERKLIKSALKTSLTVLTQLSSSLS